MKAPTTWILVADGGRALVLENHGVGKGLSKAPVFTAENENPPTREQGTDAPGRFDDAGVGRSAVQDTDWHEIEKTRFAKDVAAELDKAAQRNAYDRLVLIAPPKVLGDLRSTLSKPARERVHAEIDKDLTTQSRDAIVKHVGEVLAI
jgi:protein required for attachment to host cells